MISRRGLLVAFAAGTAAIGLTGLSEVAANAAKTYTVCKTSAVPVRGGKTFSVGGKKILITQPKKGTFKAFVAVCTHQGSPLDGKENIKNNEIVCPLHFARFDTTTGAAKPGSQASIPLGKVSVTVAAGNVRVKF
ncbi:Rieske (2Fe-2S) protein [Rhodoluna lacicola]|jgi:nitrite reductase/ring-hydroxylating ferredoxin subunit|uniref:Ferredoxin subunits of nitrite reductase and ring-hydroxylating dioxygenase n=1 Tax=Rhodoluna lacicola TaxID=529884 RepID=A0A060JGU0_9MICO|nr:Rieske (2Fe-2S) protein [Rhodoluna lacicola]AIC47950.1 Ferredoxin subunits of nitrite reductase and ring-hydroxylating dioxygenase [Rhodoluna lacicola]BDS50856.1 iron-sulfur protein [Rhodoluna lacicola]